VQRFLLATVIATAAHLTTKVFLRVALHIDNSHRADGSVPVAIRHGIHYDERL
jgi:hypothetical protein